MGLRVLVLGGGPDAEREVSLKSAAGVAGALRQAGGFEVIERTIERLNLDQLRALPGECVFPVLHGPWGEGGALQELLEADGRPFVGCGSAAARLAMDKMATKMIALSRGIPTLPAAVLNADDTGCPLPLPVVVKPIHEGSSVGVRVCKNEAMWREAVAGVIAERAGGQAQRAYMVEAAVPSVDEGGVRLSRELTVGVLDGRALAPIEITPTGEVYDYAAKYLRDDTRYAVNPALPWGVAERMARHAEVLALAMDVRHLCRVDFLLDPAGSAWMLEVNTLPGFTDHSLLPMAAKHAGMPMPRLVSRLVEWAMRDRSRVAG
jgi:D-alanine-D-alanine ligase